MVFRECIRILRHKLHERNPLEWSSVWIVRHVPSVYRFVAKRVRTDIGQIDWDRVTEALPRRYQKRWMRYRRKSRITYEDRKEVEKILQKHREKMYVFFATTSAKEEKLRHGITIALVRLSQKGNVLATRELVDLLRYIVDDWIDRCFLLRRWRAAESEINGAIEGCIRRYRYTGTFFGYLFKTFEYAAYGLKIYSLDDYLPGTDMRRAEVVGQDPETGEIKVFG